MATNTEITYRIPYISDIPPELFYRLPLSVRALLARYWGKEIRVEEVKCEGIS